MSAEILQAFLDALLTDDARAWDGVLAQDVGLRVYRCDGLEAYRPRQFAADFFQRERAGWTDATIARLSAMQEGDCIAVEFRIQATEGARYIEHNRVAFLTVRDAQIAQIDLYCPEPIPSARREGYIASADLSDEELSRLFETGIFAFDVRRALPPRVQARLSLREFRAGIGMADPSNNLVGGTRWSEAEADEQIAARIKFFRAQNAGFQWWVGPFDTPADLGKRLEKQGMVYAGEYAMMARKGLDANEIPENSALVVERVGKENPERIADCVRVMAKCFDLSQEWADVEAAGWRERLDDADFIERNFAYLAWLDDIPVAVARMNLQGGRAYLGGAATLPAYRGQKIYSTLLKRRLQEASTRGYQVAAIDAGPMSQRVVERHGFKEYGRVRVYAWMPVIDMEVIRKLVPND